MSYVERPAPSPLASCTWEQWADAPHQQRIVPDACVDLIWSGDRLTVAGPDTRARVESLAPGTRIVGVRLRPGTAGAVLGMPAFEFCDSAPDAGDVLGRDAAAVLLEAVAFDRDPQALLLRAIELRGVRAPDPLIAAAVRALGRPRARVAAVADELGLSARQLQRRVAEAVGYGPKTLQRVLRLRRLRALPRAPLAELAFDAGYADQAHMTAEVTELAGISPVRFLKDWGPQTA